MSKLVSSPLIAQHPVLAAHSVVEVPALIRTCLRTVNSVVDRFVEVLNMLESSPPTAQHPVLSMTRLFTLRPLIVLGTPLY